MRFFVVFDIFYIQTIYHMNFANDFSVLMVCYFFLNEFSKNKVVKFDEVKVIYILLWLVICLYYLKIFN